MSSVRRVAAVLGETGSRGGLQRLAPKLQDLAADSAADAFLDGVRFGAKPASSDDLSEVEESEVGESDATMEARVLQAEAECRASLELLPRVSSRIEADAASSARNVWDGFSRFCEDELGLAPATVMAAFCPPLLERLEPHRDTLDAAATDPAVVDAHVAAFTQAWREWLSS